MTAQDRKQAVSQLNGAVDDALWAGLNAEEIKAVVLARLLAK